MHSTELQDPTPWLKGGELLLTTGMQLTGPKLQRELIERLADHDIAGLGFGTGFKHKRLPAALVTAARKRDSRCSRCRTSCRSSRSPSARSRSWLNERYEMLQRNMAGDVLARGADRTPLPRGPAGAAASVRDRRAGRGARVPAARPERGGGARSNGSSSASACASLVAIRAGLLCAVLDAERLEDPSSSRARSAQELAARFGEVRAAASRVGRDALAADELPRGALRAGGGARCATATRRRSPPIEDLGAFQLLLSLQDDEALSSYCRSVLGPIEQGEGDYGDELLRSLDVFIEHNGHWEKAASALYCHRHTLRYRIRRIEQLTGRDFSNARDRIEFWLALRGRELAR